MSRLSGHPVSSSPIRLDLTFFAGFGTAVTSVIALVGFVAVESYQFVFPSQPEMPPYPAAEVTRAVAPQALDVSSVAVATVPSSSITPEQAVSRLAPTPLPATSAAVAKSGVRSMRVLKEGATPQAPDAEPNFELVPASLTTTDDQVAGQSVRPLSAPGLDRWQPEPEVLVSADPFFETQQFINEVIRQVVAENTETIRPAMRPTVHQIGPGESLQDLAARYLGDRGRYMQIFEANRDLLESPDLVKVGQEIIIPRIAPVG